MKSSGLFFTGFLLGGVLGAAIAFLFAPQSGREQHTMSTPMVHVNGHHRDEMISAELPRIILDKGNGATGNSSAE